MVLAQTKYDAQIAASQAYTTGKCIVLYIPDEV
jgi:hypothetical protein